eukprot:gnl/TRDRNA2_/TRDRNA2_92228_c1_seq1.p1 gnl/TRDRNA2_/TRDRNA2_92228_c1~~gnl/TRDRNA2_/TRDRNA2_92228_c1_seq1.p1  ORF type:complete len:288 (-),score=49.40 gnl/TRDRNA2_/TRDRNA2_92228_c1_seq1:84-947(-)
MFRTDMRGFFVATALFSLQFSVHAGGLEVLTRVEPPAQAVSQASSASLRGDGTNEAPGGDEEDDGSTMLASADEISTLAFTIACVVSSLVGVTGYIRFGARVNGDVLLSFDPVTHVGSLAMARISYATVLVSSFAFLMVPCRFAALDVLGLRDDVEGEGNEIAPKLFQRTTGTILFTCGFLSWLVQDLAEVLNFVGTWATMSLAFIMPCCLLLELRRRQEGTPLCSVQNMLPLALLALGVTVIVGSSLGFLADPVANGHLDPTKVDIGDGADESLAQDVKIGAGLGE